LLKLFHSTIFDEPRLIWEEKNLPPEFERMDKIVNNNLSG